MKKAHATCGEHDLPHSYRRHDHQLRRIGAPPQQLRHFTSLCPPPRDSLAFPLPTIVFSATVVAIDRRELGREEERRARMGRGYAAALFKYLPGCAHAKPRNTTMISLALLCTREGRGGGLRPSTVVSAVIVAIDRRERGRGEERPVGMGHGYAGKEFEMIQKKWKGFLKIMT
jgi:hypothetical protein